MQNKALYCRQRGRYATSQIHYNILVNLDGKMSTFIVQFDGLLINVLNECLETIGDGGEKV